MVDSECRKSQIQSEVFNYDTILRQTLSFVRWIDKLYASLDHQIIDRQLSLDAGLAIVGK